MLSIADVLLCVNMILTSLFCYSFQGKTENQDKSKFSEFSQQTKSKNSTVSHKYDVENNLNLGCHDIFCLVQIGLYRNTQRLYIKTCFYVLLFDYFLKSSVYFKGLVSHGRNTQPAITRRQNNVVWTLKRRQNVKKTSIQRYSDVVCQLGKVSF